MEFFKHSKKVTPLRKNTVHQLDAHQIVYYNAGNTMCYISVNGVEIPIYPLGSLSEKDYSIIVYYDERVNVRFDSSNLDGGETANNHLLIIEKKYYR